MPTLNVQSTTDRLADIDSKRLLKALAQVMLEEINALRQKAGLPQITSEQGRQAIITAYKGQQ